ncbi:MAG: 4'-phosphopantetheinyl transferase Npt [Opitutia bacterium UBA7350]|nr:MAG: 4'-phosphopantetheinyl transferase Npt [Opitutae bacterium UBA7350]
MSVGLAVNESEDLRELCPSGVVSAVCFGDPDVLPEHPAEAASCANFQESRRIEFLNGRLCARTALAEIGSEDALLSADPLGVPQWPSGFVGSISHSKGLCGAIAAREKNYFCLGLDYEKIGRLSGTASKRVVHSLEEPLLKSNVHSPTLLFSLKEAFYKAQFPKWQQRANFQDIALSLDFKSGTAEIIYLNDAFVSDIVDAVSKFKFSFTHNNERVCSICCLPN